MVNLQNVRLSLIHKITLFAIKRLIGRRFEDAEVQRDVAIMPYKIVKADNGDAWIEARNEKMAPPQVSAEVLKKNEENSRRLFR